LLIGGSCVEYFVSPAGDDQNPGTEAKPFCTIARGLQGATSAPASTLQAGDVLTLRGGTYLEAVKVRGLAGTPGQEITIRSFPGERAVIDSGFSPFRVPNDSQWVPATTVIDPPAPAGDPPPHPDEWFSVQTFPDPVEPRGAFLDEPYRRLITYSTVQDFRADNQTFDTIYPGQPDPPPGPLRVLNESGAVQAFTYPWVYMGPGLWFNPVTQRVHIRLTPTTHNVPGLEDYNGPTDPNELGFAICEVTQKTLIVADSQHLIFKDLTVRFGGDDTIQVGNGQSISFEHVEVWAAEGGVRFADSLTGVTFRNCRFDGGLPPWFFRDDRKNTYRFQLEDQGPVFTNKLGKATIDVLIHGLGIDQQDVEIDHCEFVNGHDLYLVAGDTNFHHNWIDNLDDEGLLLDAKPAAGGCIHSNVITRCLAAISMAGKGFTAHHWSIYRNLIDLRAPTAGRRPRRVGDTDVWRFGAPFKSNEVTAPDGPYDVFHNTFLVYDQRPAAYQHYSSALSPHPRRSFNNIFAVVDPDHSPDNPITFIPPPTFPGPTDGNVYHRIGADDIHAFRVVDYTFNGLHHSVQNFSTLSDLWAGTFFTESKTQYPPGFEASSCLDDPQFLHLAANGTPQMQDDLRLMATSPATTAAVTLPADLQGIDSSPEATPTTPAPAGCYRLQSDPLQVGVHGRYRFPRVPLP
jgi:hypothetical protein